ncbi:MAG TPA: methyltransferase [Myxococcales bacterium]|jgi:acetylserotonin N-methyltransferase
MASLQRARLDRALAPLRADVLRFAAGIGLLERLAHGPARPEAVRRALRLSRRGLAGLLAVLVAEGLVRRSRGRIALVPGARLPRARPGTYANPWLPAALRSEGPVRADRIAAWEKGQDLPDAADSTARMDALSSGVAPELARRWPVPRARRLLDVAGGSGVLSCAIARRHHGLRVTLADLPAVCRAANTFVARRRLGGRVGFAPLDMFRDEWPAGHDAILFGNIFHDWEDARCLRLACRAFRALPPGGSVVLHEMLLDEDGGPLSVALFSLTMFAATRGRQRTGRQLSDLLLAAGFREAKVLPAGGYFSLVWARKPKPKMKRQPSP